MPEIRRTGYFLAGLLALTLLTAFAWKPAPPAKFNGIAASQVPIHIGDYTGVDVPVDANTKSLLATADIISRQYTSTDGSVINVTIIGGTGRNELHDPRSCLVGAGWQIENDHVEQLPSARPLSVRACQIAMGGGSTGEANQSSSANDMMYLYDVNRQTIASASAIRWTLLSSDLLGQSDVPVYFVRTVADISNLHDQSIENSDEHRRLAQFTSQLWQNLEPVIDREVSK
jgi:hypothetical protein